MLPGGVISVIFWPNRSLSSMKTQSTSFHLIPFSFHSHATKTAESECLNIGAQAPGKTDGLFKTYNNVISLVGNGTEVCNLSMGDKDQRNNLLNVKTLEGIPSSGWGRRAAERKSANTFSFSAYWCKINRRGDYFCECRYSSYTSQWISDWWFSWSSSNELSLIRSPAGSEFESQGSRSTVIPSNLASLPFAVPSQTFRGKSNECNRGWNQSRPHLQPTVAQYCDDKE